MRTDVAGDGRDVTGEDWASRGFRWRDGERLLRFGPGSAAEALELLEAERLSPFVLLTTPRAEASLPRLAAAADHVVHVPAGAVPEAGLAAEAGLLSEGEPRAAALVALGGGRVIDVCKAVGDAHGLPCAAVPTTLSGAELSAFHRPLADGRGAGPNRPRLVITDPALAASQPVPGLTASALNAFGHAFEAVYGPRGGPVTTAAAVDAARRLVQGLEGVRREPEATGARAELALGALLAGYAIGSAGLGLHHVLSQTVVRHTGAPHAVVNAVLAPHTLRFMLSAAPDAVAPVTAALAEAGGRRDGPPGNPPDGPSVEDFGGAAGGQDPVAHLARFTAVCGASRLRELGVREDELSTVARLAARRKELATTPGRPGQAEALAVLRAAW